MRGRRALAMAAAVLVILVLLALAVLAYLRHRFQAELPRYAGKTMPAFQLVDLEGRKWTQADLAGKTAFINVWATWCPPCRREMPDLQKLWERVRTRPDVVLFTFNVDEAPEVVAPFVAKAGYTFPVLLAHDFVRNELKVQGIPRNWVVDRSGVWRADEIGFEEADAERWIDDAEARIAAALNGASAE